MGGQQEWRGRNTERKRWSLAKFQVVQRREKIGRIRRKREVRGLEETKKESKKERKKKQARKDGRDGFSVDRRKAASAVFPAGAPYLIRAAWDVKGREDETGLASERGSINTVFQRERHNFSMLSLLCTTWNFAKLHLFLSVFLPLHSCCPPIRSDEALWRKVWYSVYIAIQSRQWAEVPQRFVNTNFHRPHSIGNSLLLSGRSTTTIVNTKIHRPHSVGNSLLLSGRSTTTCVSHRTKPEHLRLSWHYRKPDHWRFASIFACYWVIVMYALW